MKSKKKILLFRNWRATAALLLALDALIVWASYFLALWFRFDCTYSNIPKEYMLRYVQFLPIYMIVTWIVYQSLHLYNSVWRYASVNEMIRACIGTLATALLHISLINLFFGHMPVVYFVLGAVLQLFAILTTRFFYRFALFLRSLYHERKRARVMIIGAGEAGQMILKSLLERNDPEYQVVCAIDDDKNKCGRSILGVPVVGDRTTILENVRKYNIQKIFLTMPGAEEKDRRDILNICKESGCELKNLPGIREIVSGRVTAGDMRDVAVEDLLGRKPIRVDTTQIFRYITGKTILVTGGGSIGSELCRQIATHSPRKLIIFDVYENNAYDIEQELRTDFPEVNLTVRIGSVRDSRCVDSVFSEYRPEIVYHAAAHKHVPLMEASPCEAIKNNVIGTYKTAYAAMLHGCERFVLISTDKAVNPTNIMGASKRLCEMIIQCFDKAVKEKTVDRLPDLYTHDPSETEKAIPADVHTEFVAVRFGNVLGSNGSVIPLFKKQIAAGGPVLVTHPDIIRYFMTIPEAVSLVMQAGAFADGGHIYVLDMGTPVKIDDLARNLIKLSGLRPDADIKIRYTGLRPGEKLYEEKLMAEEGLQKTDNELIHIGNPIPLDTEVFLAQLKDLMSAAYDNDKDIRSIVQKMVPTYHPDNDACRQKDEVYRSLYAEPAGVR